MLKLVPNQKESLCLLASDFPSENPRTQTRTFHTQTRWQQAEKISEYKMNIKELKRNDLVRIYLKKN